MTKDTTTPDLEDVYPTAILWTWENHFKALRDVKTVDQQLADMDAEMERRAAELKALKARHRKLGIERGGHETNAEVFLGSVEHWCKVNGDLPMPPVPVEPTVPPVPSVARDRCEFYDGANLAPWDLTRTYTDRRGIAWRWNGNVVDAEHGGEVPSLVHADDPHTYAPWDFVASQYGPLTEAHLSAPTPLEIPVTHMADVLVSNGGPYPQETREQPAVDPLEPLAPGVIDSRADVTTPDTDPAEGDPKS